MEEMKVRISQLKKFAVALIVLTLLAVGVLNSVSVPSRAAQEKDAATLFTENKCAICHGAKAEKKFDATKPEAEMVEAILKGKKGEKPPFMPAYEPKGVTAEQAKALVNYMKQLSGTESK
jgi:mono/diheme cytochrome c family protein